MNEHLKVFRREQTLQPVYQFKNEFQKWYDARVLQDPFEQYKTQLSALKTLFTEAGDRLIDVIEKMALSQSLETIYDQCRIYDLRLLWLYRLWRFFKDKFDQRDDEKIGPLLRAADEVVWSCHLQMFEVAKTLNLPETQGPAPLPFLEANYSPEAYPSELVPGSLKLEVDGTYLRDTLNALPIPVVRLPVTCVDQPWWLIFVAHEVGHTVQFQLLNNLQLVEKFRALLWQTARDQGLTDREADTWGGQSKEIFADVFSVLMVGPWALWAMIDLELKKATDMLAERPSYPVPVVRLKLLDEVIRQLTFPTGNYMRGVNLAPFLDSAGSQAEAEKIKRDMEVIAPKIVAAALGIINGLPVPLKTLAGFRLSDFQANGSVERARKELRNGDISPTIENQLRSARLISSAVVAARADLLDSWAALNPLPPEKERLKQQEQLAMRAKDLMIKSRKDGSRAAQQTILTPIGLGEKVADLLIRAGQQQLEIEGGLL